jgi:hypothetical protein
VARDNAQCARYRAAKSAACSIRETCFRLVEADLSTFSPFCAYRCTTALACLRASTCLPARDPFLIERL